MSRDPRRPRERVLAVGVDRVVGGGAWDGAEQQPDLRPGFYYVTACYEEKRAALLGPFRDHARALAAVEPARKLAAKLYASDPREPFYAYGTCRSDEDLGLGAFNVWLPEHSS